MISVNYFEAFYSPRVYFNGACFQQYNFVDYIVLNIK